MDFFDKLGKKASETYKVTAEKTGKFAKETKIKLKIGDLKTDVSGLYEQIGKKVFEKHEEGKKSVDFEKDLKEELEKLNEVTNEIAKLNKECLSLQDKKRCPKCDKEIEVEVKFCPNCGEKQEDNKEEVEKEDKKDEENKENDSKETKNEEKINDQKKENHENKNDSEKKDHKKEGCKKTNNKKDEKAKTELEKTVRVESHVEKKTSKE